MNTLLPKTATASHRRRSQRGASLLEILAYVAIVGLVAAIAIPSVQKARKNAAYNAFPKTIQGIQAAIHTFARDSGPGYPPLTVSSSTAAFNLTGSVFSTTSAAALSKALTLDTILVAEKYLEKRPSVGLGSNATAPAGAAATMPLWNPATDVFYTIPDAVTTADYSNVTHLQCAVATTNTPGTDGTNFFADASAVSFTTGTRVVSLVIPSITGTDAAALANKMNNNAYATASAANTFGVVTYAAPGANGLTTAYVYIATY